MFTDADYGWVTQQVNAIADRHAKGRIVSALEGGYALSALGRSAVQLHQSFSWVKRIAAHAGRTWGMAL